MNRNEIISAALFAVLFLAVVLLGAHFGIVNL